MFRMKGWHVYRKTSKFMNLHVFGRFYSVFIRILLGICFHTRFVYG